MSEIIINIYAYRAQEQGYGHPFTIYHVQKNQERVKTSKEKSSLKKGHEKKYQKCWNAGVGVAAAPN